MSAKKQAIKDIKEDLISCQKCFIAFRHSLDPIMDDIVNKYLQMQEEQLKP